jgi:DNA-binding PadR family transcriptional regulator
LTITNYVVVSGVDKELIKLAAKRLGRTQDPTILVLTSLTGGPKHGYALIQDIDAMSGIRMGPGTLYGVLARLEDEGFVEALESEDRRRPYRLTALGAATLRDRLETLSSVARIGLGRLGA